MAETGQAIITAIYTRITSDATIKSRFDNPVDLYRVMAPKDPDMPYMVHRLEAPGWPLGRSTYWLDLWYYGNNTLAVDSTVERIRELLENWRITTALGEIGGAGRMTFWPEGSGYISTDNPKVWHYSTAWRLWYIADRLTEVVG